MLFSSNRHALSALSKMQEYFLAPRQCFRITSSMPFFKFTSFTRLILLCFVVNSHKNLFQTFFEDWLPLTLVSIRR